MEVVFKTVESTNIYVNDLDEEEKSCLYSHLG